MWDFNKLMFRRQSRRVRLNTQPPAGATYFDPSMLVCAPCQSGSSNFCRTAPPSTGGDDGKFDWVMESARNPVMAAAVSECCATTLDAATGAYNTTCDLEQGCGWMDSAGCKFTTSGATHATFAACQSAVGGGGAGGPTQGDWFPQCGAGETANCYYPNVDACLPAVFGKQRAAAACAAYVCDGAHTIDAAGRRSFPSSACRCVTK